MGDRAEVDTEQEDRVSVNRLPLLDMMRHVPGRLTFVPNTRTVYCGCCA